MKKILFLFLMGSLLSMGQDFVPLWQVGQEDNSSDEFSVESFGPNDVADGSAAVLDDDFFVSQGEPELNFERAITHSDPRIRVHFDLTAAQADGNSMLRFVVDVHFTGRNQSMGYGVHDVEFRVNGVKVGGEVGMILGRKFEMLVRASDVGAVAGENIFELERTNTLDNGWVVMDYLSAEIVVGAYEDVDGNGLPVYWENLYGLTDASGDADGDGRANLEEYVSGTNPRDEDTDGDGMIDGSEVTAGSDPLNEDTDNDGVVDGAEVGNGLLVADGDGDGVPDLVEKRYGSDAGNSGSVSMHFSDVVGFNFVSHRDPSAVLKDYEYAGWLPQIFWNNSPALFYNGVVTGSSNLRNGRGDTTSMVVSWNGSDAENEFNPNDEEGRLLNGYLNSQTGADFGAGASSFGITGIPYSSYDVIVYVGSNGTNRLGAVRLNSGSPVYFLTASVAPFLEYTEASSLVEADATSGNYVRFRNLNGSSIMVEVAAISNQLGVFGVQVINTGLDSDGDTMPDYYEIRNGLNGLVNDAADDEDLDGLSNLEEYQEGTNPMLVDSDADGLLDGEEAALNGDPLLADTDGDGLGDGWEVSANPYVTLVDDEDSDGDGVSDYDEEVAGTDPRSTNNSVAGVPVWNSATRTWTWRVDNVRFLWDHGEALVSHSSSGEQDLAELVVRQEDGDWQNELQMGIRSFRGRITYNFEFRRGLFHHPSNSAWSINFEDWSSDGPDFRDDFGFSGVGVLDDSKPLRFEMIMHQPTAGMNVWTVTGSVYDLSDESNPVLIYSEQRVDAVGVGDMLDGSAIWFNAEYGDSEIFGRSGIQSINGIDVVFSREPYGIDDLDNNGMSDAWEALHGVSDPNGDTDNDGLTNLQEYLAGTLPGVGDSDGDGASDFLELRESSDANDSSSLPDYFNLVVGSNLEDLNGNGLSDAWEVWAGVYGLSASSDTDGDGMNNLEESLAGSDPMDPMDRFDLGVRKNALGRLLVDWKDRGPKSYVMRESGNLSNWSIVVGLGDAVLDDGMIVQEIPGALGTGNMFYEVSVGDLDSDNDGVSDWTERTVLGTEYENGAVLPGGGTAENSSGQSLVIADGTTLSGDYLRYLDVIQGGGNSSSGGGGDSAEMSKVAAARFLTQATFGTTVESIKELRSMGFEAWIDEQMEIEPTLHRAYIDEIVKDFTGAQVNPYYSRNDSQVQGENMTTAFARAALGGKDQLRQRVAFALSQILVISRRDSQLANRTEALANYYDIFVHNAFGNYADILEEVSFHPTMGWYLSHIGNQKADPSIPRYPDENYAREIMQLFTIGLWKLNPDGSRILDGEGQPIPTYGNDEIAELARVFTGLWYDTDNGWGSGGYATRFYINPMVMYPEYHDFESKKLLDGFVLPSQPESREGANAEVKSAIRHLFNHPNTPVFLSKKLIQFLVTSNPSAGYISRVQSVFVNNGEGVRGDIGAVVRAILLDDEARDPHFSMVNPYYGRLKEPVVRTMAMGRAFNVMEANPELVWYNYEDTYYGQVFQEPLNSPSVFNFFTPEYQAAGVIRDAGLVSPEFQIVNSYTAISQPNLFWEYIRRGMISEYRHEFSFDYSAMKMLAFSNEALVDHLNLIFCSGQMGAHSRSIILEALEKGDFEVDEKVVLAAYLAISCPEGAVQR